MDVTLLYFDDCPNWVETSTHLDQLADEDPAMILTRQVVDTPELAEQFRFRGSPTVLVNGRDPFAEPDTPVGFSCRIYQTPQGLAGSPTIEQLRTALTEAR